MQTRQIRIQSNRNCIPKDSGLAEISRLQQNVDMISHRNQQKYSRILSAQPHYNVVLYEPNDKLRTEKTFKKQLLLKQLDRLMDQQSIFDKKLTQIKFIKQIETQQSEKALETQMNPYRALRTAWVRHQINAIETKNNTDRIESLNFTIGIIKNTILSMKVKQEYSLAYPVSSQIWLMQKCQKLQRNYERSLMMNEELRQEISSLNIKIQAKQSNQKKLLQKLSEKQKLIKTLKKTTEATEIDHKFIVAQMKQQIFTIEKKLQKLQKWKTSLDKNHYQNKQANFKIFIEINQTQTSDCPQINPFNFISKSLFEIETFLKNNSESSSLSLTLNNPEMMNCSKLDQQNNEIMIPTLSFTETNEEGFKRKKIYTERPLKAKNSEFQKFVGNKLVNLKQRKVPMNFDGNDETIKKFIRTNQVFGTSKHLESQFSERNFHPIANQRS